jgi:AGZA family xanthine/uracil permease-like MFS transporter
VNLLLITGMCLGIGMPADIVLGKILPGTALSVLAGNIFYSWQARKLAKKEGRDDVTALPYGINTVTVFAFFSLIIVPVYLSTKDAHLAWAVGVASAFISGVFEGIGAFVGDRIRKITPRAALLSTLAGLAIFFIALDHTIKMWGKPYIAMIPLALILIEYFTHLKMPFKIPAGLYALLIGSAIAWSMGSMDTAALKVSTSTVGFYVPALVLGDIFSIGFDRLLPYMSIAIPMGLMSFFGTLQNLESASVAGDEYPAKPSLAMNGIGTMIGSIFGSPFPTTVYIGHPGWKGLGARSGYSIINGAVVTIICFTGLMGVIAKAVPLEAGYPILLWIGLIITAQAFQTTPREHAPAVALGLMPAIALWGLYLLRGYIQQSKHISVIEANAVIDKALPHMKGLTVFPEGALFTAMFITSVAVYLIEKKFFKAAAWTVPLILFSWIGLIHSNTIGISGHGEITLGYVMFGLMILLIAFYDRYFLKSETEN